MQFDEAGALVAPVRWYFTAPGALPIEGFHLYTSQNWQPIPRQGVGIGERWDSARGWSNGKAPAGATGQRKPCGTPDQWQNGCASDAPRLRLDGNGLAECCSSGSSGGIFVGGSRAEPCQPLYPFATVFTWNATHLAPVQMTFSNFATWGYLYTGFLSVACYGFSSAPYTNCLNRVIVSLDVGINNYTADAIRVSYDRTTDVSLYVVPEQVGYNPLNNFWVAFQVVNNRYFTSGGVKIGGGAVTNPTFISGRGGLKISGHNVRMLFSGHEGGILAGGSSGLVQHWPVDGGGLKLGGSTGDVQRIEGSGGLLPGGSSTTKLPAAGTGGIKAGGSSNGRQRRTLTGGLRPGGSSTQRNRPVGNGGLKCGGSSSHRLKWTGNGGVKAGGSSALAEAYTGNGGVKAGGSSVHSQGIVNLCCTGRTFPTTLFATNGLGHKFTATWDATNHWWSFTDTDIPHGMHLLCALVGSTWIWEIHIAAQAHCSSSSVVNSLSCGPPLSIHLTVTISGASCPVSGTSTYTVTET